MPASPAEIARRALAAHLAALPAGQLLHRYAASRDPEAFAGLVHRFGPLVLGACRRVLGPSADADDAFQAVFLALARQAGAFRDAKALPAWLHRVALRVSRKALARRNPAAALPDAVADPADPFAAVAWRDVRRVLDEEVDALPERYRGPVVLCWLDGLTRDEAAGRLGLSVNTVARRLDAGRALLRSRLTRRGLAPVLAAAAVATPTGLRAVVPEALRLLAVELGVGGDVPAGVAAVGVVVPTAAPTRRAALAALLGAGAAAAGGLAYALTGPPRSPDPELPPTPAEERVAVAPAPRPRPGSLQFEPLGKPLAGRVDWVTFTRDGKTLITFGDSSFGDALQAVASGPGTVRADGERVEAGPGSFGRAVHLWDVGGGKRAEYFGASGPPPVGNSHSDGLEANPIISPDGRALLTRDMWCDLYVWDLGTGKRRRCGPLATSQVQSMALSPDGKTLATTTGSGDEWGLKLWDSSPLWGVPRPGLPPPPEEFKKPRAVLRSDTHYGSIYALAFSPDGKTLAVGTSYSLRLWDVRTGRETILEPGCKCGVCSVAFSPDGRFLVGQVLREGSAEWELWVWDRATGTKRTLPSRRCDSFESLAFHPDGRTLAVMDGQVITIWDVTTGEKQTTLSGGSDWVHALAFSPDGNTLAAMCGEHEGQSRVIRLWKISRKE